MPPVPGQLWSCHTCGHCCRTLVEHITDEERALIDEQGWAGKLGVAPYVRLGRGWVLNKHEDGACVFLDDENLCLIHAKYGERAKPLACRIFPFSVRAVPGGWQASLRFDCPSVASGKGEPLSEHSRWLGRVANSLPHSPGENAETADLCRGVRGTAEEIDTLVGRFLMWLGGDEVPFSARVVGAARVTQTLSSAKLDSVRGERFVELVDLLFDALPGECPEAPEPPTRKQQAMLRQLVFAHSEHLTLAEMQVGAVGKFGHRVRQVQGARRFLRAFGDVPPIPGLTGAATFPAVEAVRCGGDDARAIEDLQRRYLYGRFCGRSVFGEGYYDWPVFAGLAALWLSVSAAGWLARCSAAAAGRDVLTLDDAAFAIGVVDRAATRAPALGTMAERTRVLYLMQDEGVARLVHRYALTGEAAS